MRNQIDETRHEVDVLRIAVEKQQEIANVARSRFSKCICEANHSRYVAIQRQIAKAVQELALANQAESDFFEELRDAGCSVISLRSMRVNEIGLATDVQSRANFHLREVNEYRPEALR